MSGQDVGQSLSGFQLVPTFSPSYLSALPRLVLLTSETTGFLGL